MNKIYRNIQRIDTQQDGRTISGYAVVFDSWSRDLGGFEEIIHKGAITQELLDNSDVIMNVNHDDTQMLARWRNGEGTLKLELRDEGLYFEFEAPQTALGDEILWHIRNGNIFDCSFCFAIPESKGAENWYIDEDNMMRREIFNIEWLHDVSVVTLGAYAETSVSARSTDAELAEEVRKRLEEEREAACKEAEKVAILDKLNNKLTDFLTNINI